MSEVKGEGGKRTHLLESIAWNGKDSIPKVKGRQRGLHELLAHDDAQGDKKISKKEWEEKRRGRDDESLLDL